jgi:integrase
MASGAPHTYAAVRIAEINPCLGVRLRKVAKRKPAYCPPDEFRQVVRAAPDALWRAYLVTLYAAGLRRGEAMHLAWRDLDFERGLVHVDRKEAIGYVQAWNPKDGERRSIPLPAQAVDLLAAWQSVAPEGCPYVFMDAARWNRYRERVDDKTWPKDHDLLNNELRRFKTICRRAGVGPYTLHDLRRSCITNWASALPVHVVQELAGHSDIQTTKDYYLSVPPELAARARAVQAALLAPLEESGASDPLCDPLWPLRAKNRGGEFSAPEGASEDES